MFRRIHLVTFCIVGLAACGQSGPLYLPQDPQPASNQEQTTQEQIDQEQTNQEKSTLNPEGAEQSASWQRPQEHDAELEITKQDR